MSLSRVSSAGIISADQQQPSGASTTITGSIPTNGNPANAADASSYASASITFGAASRLTLITVAHQIASGTAAQLSALSGSCISGAALIVKQGFQVGTGTDGMVQVWAATTTASAGTITFNFGTTVSGYTASVTEFTNVNLSLGTTGVIQSKAAVDGTGSTGASVTLDNAFGDTHNATFAAYAAAGAPTSTPKGGWTELRDTAFTPSNNMSMETQFINSNDGSAQATLSSSNRWAALAMELGAQ